MPYNTRGYLGGGAVGDPFLGGIVKGIGKIAGGFISGGPLGALGAAGGILAGKPKTPSVSTLSLPPLQGIGGRIQVPTPLGPFGVGGGARFGPPTATPVAGMGLACPSGYHANKSDYFLKNGTLVLKGSRCVRNRRRNPANPRALRRSISRVEGFGRLVQRSRKSVRQAARRVS